MGFADAIATGFRKYAEFSGRASRSEYWYWVLFCIIASACLSVLEAAIFPGMHWSPLTSVFNLAVLLPSLAVGARDIDRSGFWLLLWLVPVIGFLVLVFWAVRKGDDGENRFGADPLRAPAQASMPA